MSDEEETATTEPTPQRRLTDGERPEPGTLIALLNAIEHVGEELGKIEAKISDFTTSDEVNTAVKNLTKRFTRVVVAVSLAFLLLLTLIMWSSHRQAVRTCENSQQSREALRSMVIFVFQPRPERTLEEQKRIALFRDQTLERVPSIECDIPWFRI